MKVWLCSDLKKYAHRKIIRSMYKCINLSQTRIGLEYEVGYFHGFFAGIAGEDIMSTDAFYRYYDFFKMVIAKKRTELMLGDISNCYLDARL